jgi:hypothetical protein
LRDNNAVITRADKGNSIVILPKTQYQSKIQDFLHENNFQTTKTDPTETFQTQVKKTIKNSKKLIPQEEKWRYINLNSAPPPSIKGLIKIQKPEQPIRPIVNWRHAPAYKLARLFKDKIHQLSPLPNTFNLKNTKELIQKLEDTPWPPHFKLESLDIKNLYPSIPTKETKTILESTLKKYNINPQTEQELLNWYNTITQQKYFTNNNNILIQQDGLAIGAPSSSFICRNLPTILRTPAPSLANTQTQNYKLLEIRR